MFAVRLRACPCHPLTSRSHAARHLGHRPHALPPPGPPAALSACLPLDSAVRVCVQPAADLQHVQRHRHAVHASGALGACPCHPLTTTRAHAARHLGYRTHALLSPGPTHQPHAMPAFGLAAGRVRVQPAAELQHVQRPEHGVHASGALRACPCHPLTSRAHAARHLGHRSPGPPAALSACLPLDSAGHDCVQPAAELRHLQLH